MTKHILIQINVIFIVYYEYVKQFGCMHHNVSCQFKKFYEDFVNYQGTISCFILYKIVIYIYIKSNFTVNKIFVEIMIV